MRSTKDLIILLVILVLLVTYSFSQQPVPDSMKKIQEVLKSAEVRTEKKTSCINHS